MAEAPKLQFAAEPPARSRQSEVRTEVEGIVPILAENPGKWAKVATTEKRSTASARARMFRQYEKVEAEVRGTDVWASYDPPNYTRPEVPAGLKGGRPKGSGTKTTQGRRGKGKA